MVVCFVAYSIIANLASPLLALIKISVEIYNWVGKKNMCVYGHPIDPNFCYQPYQFLHRIRITIFIRLSRDGPYYGIYVIGYGGRYQDISGPGHLGTELMQHLGTQYWTFRYSVLDISVLNNKNNYTPTRREGAIL